MEKNLSVMDTKDPSLAPRTLDALLRSGVSRESAEASVSGREVIHVIDDHTEYSGTTLDDAVRHALCLSILDCRKRRELTFACYLGISASYAMSGQWTVS